RDLRRQWLFCAHSFSTGRTNTVRVDSVGKIRSPKRKEAERGTGLRTRREIEGSTGNCDKSAPHLAAIACNPRIARPSRKHSHSNLFLERTFASQNGIQRQ